MRRLLWSFTLMFIMAQAYAQSSRVIYGDDNRLDYYQVQDPGLRTLADSTVALMRAATLTEEGAVTAITTSPYGQDLGLCPDEPFYSQETAAFCSGFLITPNTVVTAGHCIPNQDSCVNTKFVFGFKFAAAGAQPRSVPTSQVYGCKTLVHTVSQPQGEDFAVVTLDRAVTDRAPLNFRTSGHVAVGDGLIVMGHPAGLPLKISGGANVRAVKDQFLMANLDTYGGNSGSAVINSSNGEVEGVLVRGERDYVLKNGCMSSNRCPNTGCRGEDVTLIERVLPYLAP